MSVINTNITSMIGQQNLNKSQNALQTSMERLSSGLRINSAKDDAAGQAIANRMSAQITGLAQAQRNANDGISVAQTAEGGLNQINDNLQRIRELSVQAENGTNSSQDLDSIQNEINQRLEEIDRISRETDFNGTKVLGENTDGTDPTKRTISIQVGSQDGQAINIDLQQINRQTLGLEGFNVTGAGEVDNVAADVDKLKLAGAVQQTDVSGDFTNEYVLSTDNKLASTDDVLSSISTEGSNVVVGEATYTVNADGNFEKSQTFSGADNTSQAAAIADAMTPATAGDTIEAKVTIGGESTNIVIASDGSITHAESEKPLYLDTTGNLTENAAGSPPPATIDNLSSSLANSAEAEIEFNDGTKFTTAASLSAVVDQDGNTTAAGALETAIQDAVGADGTNAVSAGDRAQLSVTLSDGSTQTIYADSANNLWINNTGDTGADQFQLDGSTQTSVSALHTELTNNGGSVTITGAGSNGGNTTNVGNTYGASYNVSLSGQEVTTADISDAMKADSATTTPTYALSVNVEDSDGNVLGTQTINLEFNNGSLVDEGLDFGAFAIGSGSAADALGTSGEEVRLSADGGNLTSDETSDVSYWAQENGNITNDSGQRIYQKADGDFTTEATSERERSSIGELDTALAQVDALRSDLGAIQNRMESAIENLSTTETNLSAARSRIEDADYATEVANMTRAQILQQAGTSVLAQANQIPQSVLSLLG